MMQRRRFLQLAGVLAVASGLSGCQQLTPPPASAGNVPAPAHVERLRAPLLLVSMDGFRWDYCDVYPEAAPTLRRLRREGVTARGLVPAFPSNTFPNHYTLVTGLHPAQHGMINNEFFDPQLGRFFRYTQPAVVAETVWWGGEPIWVTASKQGRRAATSFWVGSEAEIGGVRPTYWHRYDPKLSFAARLADIRGWLRQPESLRPHFLGVYMEDTNSAGHQFGPHSPEVAAAVALLDQQLAQLLDAFAEAGLTPNVVIVADHGMTPVDPTRLAILEDYLDPTRVQIEIEGSVVALRPLQGDVPALLAAASRIPHARATRLEDLPPHLHLRENPRLAPVWLLVDEGAHVVRRSTAERLRARFPAHGYLPGDHGYDPAYRSMHAVFIAHGPDVRHGIEVDEVEGIHVYHLLCAALGLEPAPNAGDDRLARAVLVQ